MPEKPYILHVYQYNKICEIDIQLYITMYD